MGSKEDFKAPFEVVRRIGTSMESQLVSGFTRAIKCGHLKDGMPLPGIRKLADVFGVSEITVRHAVARLCKAGLIAARPRVGLSICGVGSRSWRGTVLGIKAGPVGMFHAGVLEETISAALAEHGWLYSSVSFHQKNGQDAISALKMRLDESVALAVTFFATSTLLRFFEKSPVAHVDILPNVMSTSAMMTVSYDANEAVGSLAEDLMAAGVMTVASVYQHPSACDMYASLLAQKGLDVRPLHIRPLYGQNCQENVQRAGLRYFEKMIAHKALDFDAVVCNDDYLAAGILSAFDRNGVDMPKDIRFATLSNKGLGPVHYKELTRIEYDPVRTGLEIGSTLVSLLEDGVNPGLLLPRAEYRRGETV